ncbi:MAG: dipeptidase [Geminicoccaceae bacterium]|nr:MAG: dipeptidase [Geminicoccaceae bacterium]
MTDPLAAVNAWIEANRDASLERWMAFLRFPSIGTDPAYAQETRACAEWVVAQLQEMGFTARTIDTPGQPMVVGHHPGPGGDDVPHLLYYGHYDVQPADPLALWTSPPFEPTLVQGPHGERVVARGAVDDKGQVTTFMEAFRAWIGATGSLPCKVTVFLEGEEESGSPSLDAFLEAHSEELRADVCIVSDTGMWDIDTPALTTRLRGLVYLQLDLEGPSRDLHSGMYGGAVLNPLNTLTRLCAALHHDQGQVAVPGFYDAVKPVDAKTREAWRKLDFDAHEWLSDIGLHHERGEPGFTTLERTWARPTLDINGIWGGYTGEGAKTVIASKASAKISCRLVADQDPHAIIDAIKAYVEELAPADAKLGWTVLGAEPAMAVPSDAPHTQAAARALRRVFGKEALLIGSGGSIPAVGMIKRRLGLDSVLMGFGLDDDCVHSPNEKFERRCLENGIKSHAALLAEIVRG